jgi:hypothetical protein
MPVEKLSISFDRGLAASVKRAAQREGESVSSWLADAATVKVRQRNLREALDAFVQDHGALAETEIDRLVRAARRESRVSNAGPPRPRASKQASRKRKVRAA